MTHAGCLSPAFAVLLLWLRITVPAILRQVLQAFYGLSTSSPCCAIFDVPLSFVSTSMPSPEPTQSGDCSNKAPQRQQRAKTNPLAYLFLLSYTPLVDTSVRGVWSMRSLLDSETKRGGERGGEGRNSKRASLDKTSKDVRGCRDVNDVII